MEITIECALTWINSCTWNLPVSALTLSWWLSVDRWPRMREIRVRSPLGDRPKSFKQIIKATLPKARQHVWMSRVLGDDHYKRMPRVRRGTQRNSHCSVALSAEYKFKIWSLSPVIVTSPNYGVLWNHSIWLRNHSIWLNHPGT